VRGYDGFMKLIRVFLSVVAGVTVFGQTFEVASIRPSAPPGGDHMNVGVHIDGSQISCTQLSLKDYISAAYRVKLYQISGPDWLGSERFDISAKIPAGAKEEQVPEMLQAMLVERFQMKFHREKKDFPVYALVIAKGGVKLKETPKDPEASDSADPAKAALNITGGGGRGGVHINLGNGSSFSLADNKFIGTKLTMASFVDTLARFEDRPVVDMTDLKGTYDIELDFTTEDYTALLIRSAIAAGVTMPPEAMKALEYSSGDSLLAALEKVGLRLERRKAPLDVLTIDSMMKAPTEN
jgi:uncharacterized protein (TIGR03435 family)